MVKCDPCDAPEQCKVCKMVRSMVSGLGVGLQRPASVEAPEQATIRVDHLLGRLSKLFTPHPVALGSLAIERDVYAPCLGVDMFPNN